MGLDQWLYKMRRLDAETVARLDGMDEEKAREMEGIFLVKCREETDGLADVADKVRLVCHYIDEEKLFRDYSIPKEARCNGYSIANDRVRLFYAHLNQNYRVFLTPDEIRKNYDRTEDGDFWACSAEEIHYWRKAYDIQNALYSRHEIVNCGYHRLDGETIGILEQLDRELFVPYLEDGEAVIYHEWY